MKCRQSTLICIHPAIMNLGSIFTESLKGLRFPSPYLQAKNLAFHGFMATGRRQNQDLSETRFCYSWCLTQAELRVCSIVRGPQVPWWPRGGLTWMLFMWWVCVPAERCELGGLYGLQRRRALCPGRGITSSGLACCKHNPENNLGKEQKLLESGVLSTQYSYQGCLGPIVACLF